MERICNTPGSWRGSLLPLTPIHSRHNKAFTACRLVRFPATSSTPAPDLAPHRSVTLYQPIERPTYPHLPQLRSIYTPLAIASEFRRQTGNRAPMTLHLLQSRSIYTSITLHLRPTPPPGHLFTPPPPPPPSFTLQSRSTSPSPRSVPPRLGFLSFRGLGDGA